MPKYIDASAFMKILTTATDGTRIPDVNCDNFPRTVSIRELKRLIYRMPAADVQEIKHGHWTVDDASGDLICSECGHFTGEIIGDFSEADEELAETLNIPKGTIIHRSMNPFYCSGCGAKMDGGVKK